MKITNDCMACGLCVDLCPSLAIRPKTREGKGYAGYEINPDDCTNCEACLEADCPANAIKED